MSNSRIFDSLPTLFESFQIVFWHDVESEFSASIDALTLDGVQLVRLDDMPALRVKIDIEHNSTQRWLLYSNQPAPELTKDWLLDVRLRSKSFRGRLNLHPARRTGPEHPVAARPPEGASQVLACQGPA